MPTFQASRGKVANADVEVVAVGAIATADPEDAGDQKVPPVPRLGPGAEAVAEALGVDLFEELRFLRFAGRAGSIARIPTRGAIRAETVLVVGLGQEEDLDAEVVRRAGAAVADATTRASTLATTVPADAGPVAPREAAQAFVEGLALGAYRFTAYKSSADGSRHHLDRVSLHPAGEAKQADLRPGLDAGEITAGATALARDLVNEPPAGKRPPALADRVRREVRGTGIKVKVLDEKALEQGGYGGILAVGQGSDAPPRLVELTYAPKNAQRHVAIVGKGITFDTGGLSIKPSQSMMTMKLDMAGAAAVVATMRGAAELELPVRITGVLALAENMPSGSAQRPSDVYTSRNGKTVEVLNTDAEGRLVLSDALDHAAEKGPDAIVDVATLTGAVKVALGSRFAALMATDDALADELLAASDRSGERLWRLPLPDDYREHIDSDVADMKNIGKPGVAGTIIGGLFLKEFVPEGLPWAHLDIAELAWSEERYGYIRKGGTGAPVRTLLAWLSG